jgi:hypothetical protein
MLPSTLRLVGSFVLPILLTHCGGPTYVPPDYTPIGDSIKFIGICVVVAVLVTTFASLIAATPTPPSADEADDD